MGWAMQGQCMPLGGGSVSHIKPHKGCSKVSSLTASSVGAHSIMASALQSALAAGLEVVLQGIGIHTLDDLASGICDRGDEIADYISSSGCRRAALVAAQERERAAQAVAGQVGSAASSALSRAQLEAELLHSELASSESDVALLVEGVAASSTPQRWRSLLPLASNRCRLQLLQWWTSPQRRQ